MPGFASPHDLVASSCPCITQCSNINPTHSHTRRAVIHRKWSGISRSGTSGL